MFEAVEGMLDEHAELERQLADPDLHTDQSRSRTLGRRYAELTPIVETYRAWRAASGDLATAIELAREDSSFHDEASRLEAERDTLAEKLSVLLVPRDPADDKDVILEIKAGEGGDESALFARDLLRMYLRFAERQGWKTEVIDATESDLGGYKDVSVAVKARGDLDAPYRRLKFEGG